MADKFLCYQLNNESEDEAKEIEADFAEDAVAEYFEKYVLDTFEADGLIIRVKYPETGMEWDFRTGVHMEPVYYFEEVD
jgi:hypothetical protein